MTPAQVKRQLLDAVTNTMKVKGNMEMGVKPRCRGGFLSFSQHLLLQIPNSLQKSVEDKGLHDSSLKSTTRKSSLIALRAARAAIKKASSRKKISVPQHIPFASKGGGLLLLIPKFAGVSALRSLAGGTSDIASTWCERC